MGIINLQLDVKQLDYFPNCFPSLITHWNAKHAFILNGSNKSLFFLNRFEYLLVRSHLFTGYNDARDGVSQTRKIKS